MSSALLAACERIAAADRERFMQPAGTNHVRVVLDMADLHALDAALAAAKADESIVVARGPFSYDMGRVGAIGKDGVMLKIDVGALTEYVKLRPWHGEQLEVLIRRVSSPGGVAKGER